MLPPEHSTYCTNSVGQAVCVTVIHLILKGFKQTFVYDTKLITSIQALFTK